MTEDTKVKSQELNIDSEFKELLFPLEMEELMALDESIKREGCRDPIVVWNDIIIDGHNRYRICKKFKIDFKTINRDFKDRDEAKVWILDNQLARRNLSPFQRTEINIKRGHIWANRAKENQQARKGGQPGTTPPNLAKLETPIDTREEIAKASKVSHGTVSKVEKILEEGSQKEIESVRKGDITIHAAYKKVDRRVKQENRQKENEKSVRELPDYSDRFKLICKNIKELDEKIIESDSIDVIITDPPYSRKFLELFEELARLAKRVLKPGGSLVVMAGQSYLPEVLQQLSKHMKYQWTLAYLTPGGQAVQLFDRKVNTFWKPLLWFVKGKYNGEWIGDVAKSEPNDNDKRFHEWGQSESGMRDIVERFTRPGMTILDPFLGGGTTGVVCIALDRKFIGIDNSKDAISTTEKRIIENIPEGK